MFILEQYKAGKLEKIGENNTETVFTCPVCNGKIKARKDNGAYLCVTNYCDKADIRAKLGASSKDEYKPPPLSSFINPVHLHVLKPPIPKPDNYEEPIIKNLKDRRITTYKYNDTCLIERVDYIDKGKKKEFYPKHKVSGIWRYGGSSPAFKLFNSRYINVRKNGCILIAEGEKTANLISVATNYLCLSPPVFGWKQDYISNQLTLPNISGVLYFADNDEAGAAKAKIVKLAAWSVGIPCAIFSNYSRPLGDGEDLVDLYENNINIKELIDNDGCFTGIRREYHN